MNTQSQHMPFRTAYGPRVKTAVTDFSEDKGKTIKEQQAATDINNILERYARTGLIEHVKQNEPQFGEFADYDFQTNQNMIVKIQSVFDSLPARDRAAFDHKPENYLEFIQSQQNIDDMKDGEIDGQVNEKPTEETTEPTIPIVEKPTE